MPAADVSDLRDVVDAINKLCETMKTSYDEYEDCLDAETEAIQSTEVLAAEPLHSTKVIRKLEVFPKSRIDPGVDDYSINKATSVSDPLTSVERKVKEESDSSVTSQVGVSGLQYSTSVDHKPIEESILSVLTCEKAIEISDSMPLATSAQKSSEVLYSDSMAVSDSKPIVISDQLATDTQDVELMTDHTVDSESTLVSDSDQTDPTTVEQAYCDPTSEMYYTASSEVSLLSDIEFPDRQSEDSDRERDDRNSVMAGHVAAMRERFESMTRTNTPCPELMRSVSPSFEVFKNFSTSPEHLEKS